MDTQEFRNAFAEHRKAQKKEITHALQFIQLLAKHALLHQASLADFAQVLVNMQQNQQDKDLQTIHSARRKHIQLSSETIAWWDTLAKTDLLEQFVLAMNRLETVLRLTRFGHGHIKKLMHGESVSLGGLTYAIGPDDELIVLEKGEIEEGKPTLDEYS